MKKILLFAVAYTVLFVSNSFAQFPGCPAVSATTAGIVCGQNCTNLTATAFGGAQTTAYSVSSISYTPPFAFNTGTQILVNIDDRWSSAISLPFHFCFFGNDYTSIIVGSNGICSFNTANAGAFNNWNIPAGGIPSTTDWPDLHNSIMGPWQDIDPTNQGQIFYEIGGTAPCRYFKVSWYNVPYYGADNSVSTGSCPGQNLRATQQIILYETTNVIDMYIQQKQFCSGWDGGVAVQGIQNANGTVAYTVPGRNGTQWACTNDAKRFSPSGAPNYTIAWFQGSTQVGTGNTITVCPPGTTVYTAKATYTDCSTATPDIEVTSDVTVGFAGITTTIDSVHTISCNGGSDGAAYASFSVGSTVLSYGWSPGGTPNQTSITGIPAGTYVFSVTDGANCTRYDTVVLVNPPLLTVNVPDTAIISCGAGNPTGSLTATPTGGTPGYTYLWTGSYATQTISGVSPGVYIATVTDSKGCTASDGGTITVNTTTVTFDQPTITDASCGGSNGAITVSVSGATPTVTYTWSNSLPNGNTQTGLAGGTYSVTATDANGCSATASYTVGVTSAISFNAPLIEDASCAGNDGNIEVSLTGATPTVTYSWSNGLPDSDVQSGLAAGTYCVTATDGNACTASACYTIAQAAPITFGSPVITDASCGGNDGSIVVTVNGATNPIVYTWSNSLPDNDTVIVAAGTYTVTATDANGCSATASYTVGQAPAFTFGTPVITDATCAGANGSIVVTINGAATNPIVYTWSNSLPDNDTVTGLAAGTYTVTGTDANGCSATASYTVGQSSSALTFGNPVIIDASCKGDDGSIVVVVNGATDPITYTWSNGLPNNDTVTALGAGTYLVTATDANGCSATASYTVGQTPSFTFGTPVITDATCASNDGSIVVTINGSATSPIVYTWTNGLPDNDTVTGLATGVYSVTATDANGCSATASYTVGQGTSIVITNAVVTDVSCSGTGSIAITATGGTGTLTYSWSGNLTGNPLTGLSAGTYNLTITDQGGCSVTASYIVGNTPCGDCPAVSTNNNVTIPCGETCANLTATAVAGAQTTSYSGAAIAYSPAAAYNTGTPILVGDDDIWSGAIALPFNFCFFGNTYGQLYVGSNGVVGFNAPPLFNNNSWEITGPIPSATPNDLRNCIMGPWHDMDPSNQGTIYYSIIGTYPCRKFVVSWYQVPMFGDPNSSNPGTCNAQFETQQIVLYETTNVIDIYIKDKTVCAGWNDGLAIEGIQNANGTVAYAVPGRNATVWTATNDAYRFTPAGAPNYVINWYQGATQIGTGDSITVCPDSTTTYTVEAVYTNCDNSTITVSDSVFVTVQGGLTATVDSVSNVSCFGANDGAVYASYESTNGTVTSFGWTPGGANQTSLTNIPAGTYVFTVTNSAGCTVTDTAIVAEPAQLVVNVTDTTLYNCVQAPVSTSLTASATGGTPQYTYDWGGGNTNPTLTGLDVGTYPVTVTDANGCSATGDGTVTLTIANPVFNQPVITNVTCNGGNDGSIVVSVSQATPAIDYTWSNSLPNNDTVSNLTVGTYLVTATDANGCSATASYDVTEPTPIVIGNPTITDATCTVGGTITVSATGGTGTLTYGWSNGDSGTFIDSLAAGPYTLTVTDASGCTATASYVVDAAPNTVAFGTPTIVDVTCNGGNNGSITATATGGTGTITFVWNTNPQQNGATISGLTAGSYTVTITDAVGCSASTTYTVAEPTAIVVGTPVITPATCLVGGTVTVTATGGTGTLTYGWSNGDTGTLADSLQGGTVTLTVTDANACSVTASFNVPSPNAVSLSTSTVTDITCNGAADGSIHVVVVGGTGTIVYVWNPIGTSTDSIATGLAQGSYSVTVTDAVGCSATATYSITEPTAVTLGNPAIVDATCSQGGSITAAGSGGTGTLDYAWTGPSSSSLSGNPITNLTAGTYTLTVTDDNGCSATASYTVGGASGTVTLGTPVINNVSCNGANDGSITATATGTGTITYTWSTVPQQVGATITGLAPGSYTVTASSSGGNCSASATYTITEPTALSVTVNATSLLCFGDTTGSATAVVTGGTGNYTYEWNPAQSPSTNTAIGLEVGIVLVTVTDANGCTATDNFIIGQSPSLSYNSQVNQPSCADLGFGTEILTPRGGTGAITVSISGLSINTTLTMVGADTVLTVPNVPTGTYTFTLTDALGCSTTGNFFVNAGAANESFDLVIDSTSCFGDRFNDGSIVVTPNSDANNAPYTYSFNGGGFQTDSAWSSLTAGTYTIITKNTYGCLDTLTAVVEQPARLFVDATPDTIVTGAGVGNDITTTIQGFVSNPVYTWSPVTGLSCNDCANPTATVNSTTVFYVQVSEDANKACAASDSVVIIVNGRLKMPNAFSPNSDGRNDSYGPVNRENTALTVTAFRIYNRWGELVHNDTENWNGKLDGKDQPAGTYIYYISVKTPDENNPGTDKVVTDQGAFTLLR